ncbi:Palmitoyltransferase zdhhc16 [Mactra antiquata]
MLHTSNQLAGYIIRILLMPSVIKWLPWKIRRKVRRCLDYFNVLYMTLCYNYFTTIFLAFETLLEPLFWFVDRFAKYLGPFFVTLVSVMTTSIVTIFYVCLLPHVYENSLPLTVFHLIFGHWLLVNIVFHYVMAVFTQPGTPPDQNVPEIVSICKKCISPKPPRTHHCTICGKCILKMDHHCPWLNNCVGHNNHRYFFLFCVYMWFGTVYVSWTGHELFRQHFYGDKPTRFPAFMYPLNALHDTIYNPKEKTEAQSLIINDDPPDRENYKEYYYHVAVLYQFILCSGVTLALGLLMLWHARLISVGETSIEVHINDNQRRKYKKKKMVYKNPYHYGFTKNWQVFLGFSNLRTFITHVLLPSTHRPESDGLIWPRAAYKYTHSNGLPLL